MALSVSPAEGLTSAEAARRLAARGDELGPATSRSWASILRANLLTVFNVILLAFGILTLAFGDVRDAIFLAILVVNAGIGITQEARAKAKLDRLAALVAPSAQVVRDGVPTHLHPEEVVAGDLVLVGAGDQVVADGTLADADGLGLDESILTGESEPVTRGEGDQVRAGSFAVEGAGAYVAESVGNDTYAARLVGEARAFRHPRSPLERALDRLILILTAITAPLAALLIWSLLESDVERSEAVSTTVAGVVTIVPEGLVLLTGLTYAVAAARLARRGALTQQLNAVESLASATVVCLDKTGTLTEEALRVVALHAPSTSREEELVELLGRYAASAPSPNATLTAIAEAHPQPALEVEQAVPFSSRRRWSGARVGGRTIVLGAPELFPLGTLESTAETQAASGRRVLAVAEGQASLEEIGPDDPPPAELSLAGLVVLAEELRPDARETVAFLRAEGVDVRVLSGDAPATVGAIAADAGIPVGAGALDGRALPDDPAALAALLEDGRVIGRISPDGKRRVVDALAGQGAYVAMVGDGVNDVPALKAARLAIAQGSGSQMARSVADVVLVRSGFAAVPTMIREGRKLLRNLQRVAKLFVAKSVLAAFLIMTVGLSNESYPFLPRHLTLASAVTIGIPAFLLALAPSAGAWRTRGFLRDLARFAVPAGAAAGFGVVASYLVALNLLDLPQIEASTVATTVLVGVGLYLIIVLESSTRVRNYLVGGLCAALAVAYLAVLSLSDLRSFFEVASPTVAIMVTSIAGIAFATGSLMLTDERFIPYRRAPVGARAD